MQINFVSNNAAENWRRFERQFRVYYAACEIASKSAPTQVGILLHTAGPEAQDVHETFTYTGDEQRNDIETVLLKFRSYCEPWKNIVFERYQLWNRNQNASEPIDQWVTDLRSKACEFGTFESDMIRDKVVFGVRDERMAIRMPKQSSNDKRECTNTSVCKYCGKSHAPRQCAAYGKLCKKCGGPNHFASICLGGVVWHAALPLVDLCTLSRVAIPAGYSSVQYMSVKLIAVGGTLTCL